MCTPTAINKFLSCQTLYICIAVLFAEAKAKLLSGHKTQNLIDAWIIMVWLCRNRWNFSRIAGILHVFFVLGVSLSVRRKQHFLSFILYH